jgi:hypothetical protein
MERGACGSSNLETSAAEKEPTETGIHRKKRVLIIKRGVQCQTAARKIENMPL